MSNWSLKNPPSYRTDAVAGPEGWKDPVTGEVLVAIGGLTTKQVPLASWPTFTLAVPANGTYPAGTPSIDVTFGTTVRQAQFTGIDVTNKILTFEYTTIAGDDAPSGIVVSNTIDLNTTGKGKSRVVDELSLNSGETIPAASLTFTVPATAGIITTC